LYELKSTYLHLHVALNLDESHLELPVPRGGQAIALGMDLRGSQFQAIAGLPTCGGGSVDIAPAEGLDHALLPLRTVGSGAIHTQSESHSTSLVDAALAGGRAQGRGLGDLGHVHAALPLQRGRGGGTLDGLQSLGFAQLEHAALALLLLHRIGGQQLALSTGIHLGHIRGGGGLLEPGEHLLGTLGRQLAS